MSNQWNCMYTIRILFLQVFCGSLGLIPTYSHIPGGQRGPHFSDFSIFLPLFLCTNWCTTISIVRKKIVYTKWYNIQIQIIMYKFVWYTNSYIWIHIKLYKLVYTNSYTIRICIQICVLYKWYILICM